MTRLCCSPLSAFLLVICVALRQFAAVDLALAIRLPAWRIRSNHTGISCISTHCPLTTVCNPRSMECECESDYLVAVSAQMPCLTRKYLGELCIHSSQCAHIDNAICISNAKRRNELLAMPFKDLLSDARMWKQPEKYLPYKQFGRCECKKGYWPNQNQLCELKSLALLECTESHQGPDPNSYCDLARRKCTCDLGHMYDASQDRCMLNLDMLGVFCETDLDCQIRDEQMRCWMGTCTCINQNRYDPIRGCGAMAPCKSGQTWSHFSKSCEPSVHKPPNWTSLLDDKASGGLKEWTQLSAEVWFKLLVFFIFLVGVYCVITRRKECLPPNLAYSSGSAHLDANRAGRGWERHNAGQVPLSSHMHAIHLRVNLTELDDIERGCLTSDRSTNRRPSQGSNSSLPAYDSLDNRTGSDTAKIGTPPPSYEQLPSYDEVMNDTAKGEQSCAKEDSNDHKDPSQAVTSGSPHTQE